MNVEINAKIDVFPEFQAFLKDNVLVPAHQMPYYANWVSQFLDFSQNYQNENLDVKAQRFINHLKVKGYVKDWQIHQAESALDFYINSFLGGRDVLDEKNKENDLYQYQIIQEMRELIRVKHYSYKTERSYIDWIKRFFNYLINIRNKNIKEISSEDVKAYLTYLAVKQKVASSTQNQAFNAVLFLCRNIIKTDIKNLDNTVRAKRGPKLPVVLTIEEVKKVFSFTQGKNLLILQLLYGAGLRLMELVRLRVQDIDFESNLIYVRAGKGDKDRTTILPEYVKPHLSAHLEKVKELHQKDTAVGYGQVYLPDSLERKYPQAGKEWKWQYVFPAANISVDPRSNKIRRHHISEKSIQNAVRDAAMKADIVKHATVHTLRHSFATHLLMSGVNIREIQELLGHKSIETTMIYTHVLRDITNVPKSPLDILYEKK